MIITKTPYRISFVGGGSDLESFYSKYGGAVLSTSINKYMYISSHKFFDEKMLRIKYSKSETVKCVDELEHPIAREVLKKFNTDNAIEISSNGDMPSRSGMGSSSSFTVGMLHNLYVREGTYVTKERLAQEACEIEIDRLNEPIGKQDQYAAAFGGFNLIKFNKDGSVNVDPVCPAKEISDLLNKNLLLFHIGWQRAASSILSEQKQNMEDCRKVEMLKRMVALVPQAVDAIYNGNLKDFGEILNENWFLKQNLASKITNDSINEIYELGITNGAVGGKLLGAGGGGIMLFYCEQENQNKLREAMCNFRELEFSFDKEGSKIIYVGDE